MTPVCRSIVKVSLVITTAVLTGCVLKPAMKFTEPAAAESHVVLSDKRSKKTDESHIDRMKALVYFGDASFTPSAQALLHNSLAKYSDTALTVELTEFSVIQGYGYSLAKTIGGGILVELISDGYLGEQRIKQGSDVVICIASGQANGKSFRLGSVIPYKLNPFSSPVWNDEAANRAVREAIDETARKIVEKSK